MSRKKILLFTDWYAPAYKAGGPIRSCLHFVQHMRTDYDVYVFTSDRDLNETKPLDGIISGNWISVDDNVSLFYCPPQQLTWENIREQARAIEPDFIYLNSMFSRYFTIYPLLMAKRGLTGGKVVLSPRGMLKDSALQFKSRKKKLYLGLFRSMGLHKLVHFHATDKTEQEDIRKQFGNGVTITLAPNFAGIVPAYAGSVPKAAGGLSAIFIGRIHPIKNLDFLLGLLPKVKGRLLLTIAGNEEDPAFAARCRDIIAGFAPNISVHFTGELPHEQLSAVLAQHHIFVLPTRGENFGHAIFEALVAGKPVIISDQTPWRQLTAEKAGWDIPLTQVDAFIAALQQAMDFNQPQYDEWSAAAWRFVQKTIETPGLTTAYQNIFS